MMVDRQFSGLKSADQVIALLSAKDDTSRFVGLTILCPLLEKLKREEVEKCWEAIDGKFLDRLLKTKSSSQLNGNEIQGLIDLAASVIHAFAVLTNSSKSDEKLCERVRNMVPALELLSKDARRKMLETLLAICTKPGGAKAVLNAIHILGVSKFLALANDCQKTQKEAEQTLGENRGLFMSVIATAYIAVDKQDGNTAEVMIKEILRTLFEQNDEHSFLKVERETTLVYLSSMLQTTPLELLPHSPQWALSLCQSAEKVLFGPHSANELYAVFSILSCIMHKFSPALVFSYTSTSGKTSFASHFMNLILADLLSSFPTLTAEVGSHRYATLSVRLGREFDILLQFINFLVSLSEAEGSSHLQGSLTLTPSQILNFRQSAQDVFSQLIEHLRDRWDEKAESFNEDDPFLLCGLKALCLWLREDDTAHIKNLASSILDILLLLWDRFPQFQTWLIAAFPQILEEKEEQTVEIWKTERGFDRVFRKLKIIVDAKVLAEEEEILLGIECARFLYEVVDLESPTHVGEVGLAAAASNSITGSDQVSRAELEIWWVALFVRCLDAAPNSYKRQSAMSLFGLEERCGDLKNRTRHGGRFGTELDSVLKITLELAGSIVQLASSEKAQTKKTLNT